MQFALIWGNFLGYTGMHHREFGLKHLSMSSETLARRSIGPLDDELSLGTSLYEQGTTLFRFYVNSEWDPVALESLYNCPAANLSDSFCSSLEYNQCQGSEETESLTSNAMIGIMLAFTTVYMLLAAYWIQVVPSGVRVGFVVVIEFQFLHALTTCSLCLLMSSLFLMIRMEQCSPFIFLSCVVIGLELHEPNVMASNPVGPEYLLRAYPRFMGKTTQLIMSMFRWLSGK